jgi:hypothetical protein
MSQSGKPFKYSQSMDRGNTHVGQTARLRLSVTFGDFGIAELFLLNKDRMLEHIHVKA